MNAAPLIRELQATGIRMSASTSGDHLHVEAPAGTVTPELRQHATATDTRAALSSLANMLGIDSSIVVRIPSADLPLWASVPTDAQRVYLLALDDAATRQTGKLPLDDTAPIYCAHCGPVYVHPSIAAVLPVVNGVTRTIGCPWCAIRKAGGYVPQPAA